MAALADVSVVRSHGMEEMLWLSSRRESVSPTPSPLATMKASPMVSTFQR
eukprot:CAMPEP_0197505972 /NCGR_PEP_ID=MMETSP1312-20131121/4835_1 /TAXON_ID=464262 /ORGANISM="Genus nov. species nov., Strain RCC2335" /LENGTH=49 /DNA_ID= /DNA_START= /DNA_END= /DNA_ORIENTATION=